MLAYITAPIRNEPITLTAIVPYGKAVPSTVAARFCTANRAPVPAAPPRQISRNRITGCDRASSCRTVRLPQTAANANRGTALDTHPTNHHDHRMRIVITGATGFVGTALTARLLADGH